jgi:hypothetical protein
MSDIKYDSRFFYSIFAHIEEYGERLLKIKVYFYFSGPEAQI